MPQWRKLHTKTAESLDLNDMPDDFTRLMWVLLPLKLCREGRGIDMAPWIKSQLFPLRSDVTLEQVERAMNWYHSRGMIARYIVQGRPYFQIRNWHKYQGTTDREADSPYPSLEEADFVKEKESNKEKELKDIDKDIDIDIDTDASQKTNSQPSRELVVSKSRVDNFEEIWSDVLYLWGIHFPEKPQPRENNKALRAKLRTRLKDDDFGNNWKKALARASESDFLNDGGFFTLNWFLKNDENWRKCLDGNYDNPKGVVKTATPEPRGFAAGRKILQEIESGTAN